MTTGNAAAMLIAGAIGAIARAALSAALQGRFGAATATGFVNLLGAAALGGVQALEGKFGAMATQLITAGFLGAFTTYATWLHEAAGAWRAGRRMEAVLGAAALLAAGVAITIACRAVFSDGDR